jgi:hypothetical protein
MRVAENRILALAARYGRIAYVYIKNGQPKGWGLSCTSYKSPRGAATMTGSWIAKFDPDVVIIEDPKTALRKGRKTKSRLRSMLRVAERSPAMVAKAKRIQHHKNAYLEAQSLVEAFPQMADKLPLRRFYDTEPRNLVLFEAVALAQSSGFLRR